MANPNQQFLDRVERDASRREIFCTEDEAARFGLHDTQPLRNAIRWLYVQRRVLVKSTKAVPGRSAGYRYKHAHYASPDGEW